MTNNQKYHKNYTEFGEPYQLVLPLNLEGLVPDDDSVRLLSHELEELDYSLLYQAYSAKGRNPTVDPKTMFKILTYAYSQNIYSSRKIETACKRDINFMWLLAGQKAPDHSTIARFRTGFLADACENLFYQMVKRLEKAGELSKETVFIDGTKLEACANRHFAEIGAAPLCVELGHFLLNEPLFLLCHPKLHLDIPLSVCHAAPPPFL